MKRTSFWFLFLHIALFIYSTSGLFSKMASKQAFLSPKFILFYGGMLVVMVVYAVLWQQVIKHLPLTTAYANKAVTIVWGIILGVLVFREQVSVRQVIAAVIIVFGAVLYALADREVEE